MARPALARLFWLAFGVAGVSAPRLAQAEPASAEPASAEPAAATAAAATPAPPAAGAIELLASLGWGASTNDVLRLKMVPYRASAGLDVGYTWPSGFRLGAYFGYSLGGSATRNYDPLIGRNYDVTADTSSLNAGLSVGYDVPLYRFVLRYGLGVGFTSMSWDFGSNPPDIAEYSDSPTVGFHLAPGATLLWRSGSFQGGLGFRYLAQLENAIPNGFLGELVVGVRL
jgi:hypothetical protein